MAQKMRRGVACPRSHDQTLAGLDWLTLSPNPQSPELAFESPDWRSSPIFQIPWQECSFLFALQELGQCLFGQTSWCPKG